MYKNTIVFFVVFCAFQITSLAQQDNQNTTAAEKSILAGITSIASSPYFLNVLPNLGYYQYNSQSNLGFLINIEYLIRPQLDNFMVVLTQAGIFKKVGRERKFPIELGAGIGAGINSVPYTSLLAFPFISIPFCKLKLKCQPTVVVPSLKSSYINLNVVYSFKISNKK